MPRDVLEFRVVIASPSELFETRKVIFDVIRELNRILECQRIAIRGLGWEEYATPGIEADAQTLINQQVLREYDILVGVFATKLGSPTLRAPSGTIEEIEHAIANTESPMGQHRVQVYFRDRIDTASLDLDEFKKVMDFRESLKSRGVLYRLFKDDGDLQSEIRVNLQRPILEYLQSGRTPQSSTLAGKTVTPYPPSSAPSALENDDFGILDHAEKIEEAIGASVTSLESITGIIEAIGEETNRQVLEVEKISSPAIPAKEKKTVINGFANFLKSKAADLKREAAAARENFTSFVGGLLIAANFERQHGDAEKYKNDIARFLAEAENILVTIPQNRASILSMKTAVENLPRITIQFNQAKKELIDALDECLDLFDHAEMGIYKITAGT